MGSLPVIDLLSEMSFNVFLNFPERRLVSVKPVSVDFEVGP